MFDKVREKFAMSDVPELRDRQQLLIVRFYEGYFVCDEDDEWDKLIRDNYPSRLERVAPKPLQPDSAVDVHPKTNGDVRSMRKSSNSDLFIKFADGTEIKKTEREYVNYRFARPSTG